MAIVHQSDISAWIRCPQAFMYGRTDQPRRQTSALSYGSVMHHAMEAFERLRHTPDISVDDATEMAVQTFRHYWHPMNIEEICAPVDLWLPRQSYSDLLHSGSQAIRDFAELIRYDDHELLATEYSFSVPIAGTWDEDTGTEHILNGTIDRLAVRFYGGRRVLCVDDWKTGKEYQYLRQNLQFTGYCMATTHEDFWTGAPGEDGFGERGHELFQRFKSAPRRGTWINMRKIKFQDAGWRGPDDYTRFALAVEQLVASMKADIYPLNLSGETCTYCEYRDICAGVGVPDAKHGSPGQMRAASTANAAP
jgi:hypothetical protein